jgi:hypothetical protein
MLLFMACIDLWQSLHDFDMDIFRYELFKLYARLSLMLFIAPLMNFSVTTCAP